jgi:hypothetical protein
VLHDEKIKKKKEEENKSFMFFYYKKFFITLHNKQKNIYKKHQKNNIFLSKCELFFIFSTQRERSNRMREKF